MDIVSSTRFESEDLDNGLNVAIDNKVRESYDQNMPMNKSDAFQRVQRVRDELGGLVKKLGNDAGPANPTEMVLANGNEIRIQNENYRHLLALRVVLASGGWHPAYPLSYDRKNVTPRNPFRRVRSTPQSKIYYIEHGGTSYSEGQDTELNIFIELPSGEVVTDFELSCLMNPAIVNYGVEQTASYSFTNGEQVIAVEETVYAGVTYVIGQKFTITTGSGLNITTGRVVHQYVECDVRGSTHEEISRRAAINLLLTANEKDKALALRQEITAQ